METKETYQKKCEVQVKEWNTLISLLAAKMEKADAGDKRLYAHELIEIAAKQRDAMIKMKELEEASDEVWETIKINTDKAGFNFGASVAQAITKF